MSIFELTLLISLLAGSVLGGASGRSFGVFGILLGIPGGLLIGLSCYFGVLGLSIGLAKIGRATSDPPKNPYLYVFWWIANFVSVMMMTLAPVATVLILKWLRLLLKE